jgi:hypothetical protein
MFNGGHNSAAFRGAARGLVLSSHTIDSDMFRTREAIENCTTYVKSLDVNSGIHANGQSCVIMMEIIVLLLFHCALSGPLVEPVAHLLGCPLENSPARPT